MLHWFAPLFPFGIIITLINFLLCASVIIFFSIKYKIESKYLYLLLITLISPILFNGPLMPWTDLPDQSKYLLETMNIRDLNFASLDGRVSIFLPSLIFSISPLPFIESFNDIGLINRTLLSLLAIYLIKNKTKEIFIYFLILSPTILIYSSVALKDTLVVIITLFAFKALAKRRNLFFFLIVICLILFKKQNGFIILPMYFFYIYYFDLKFKFKNIISLIILILFVVIIFNYKDIIINTMNSFRFNFYQENNGEFGFIRLKSYFDLFLIMPFNYLRFLLSPFPEISSPVRLLIFFENIIVMGIFFYYFSNIYKKDFKIFYYWFIFFIIFLSMYSLTIINHGTISRYKISFIVPFFFILTYINKNFRLKLKKNE